MKGDRLGTHRVLEPAGALPQGAWRLDNDPGHVYDDEVVIDVETLNIDSASFRQMEEAAGEVEPAARAPDSSAASSTSGPSAASSSERVARLLLETVAARGKQHNPVT